MALVAALAVAFAVFVTAALGAIAAIDAQIVVFRAGAAVLALAAAGFAPAIVAVLASALALPVVTTLHTVTRVATRERDLAVVWRANRGGAIGLVEAGEAVAAIARGARAIAIPAIAVPAAFRAGKLMLVIDTTEGALILAEVAIDMDVA